MRYRTKSTAIAAFTIAAIAALASACASSAGLRALKPAKPARPSAVELYRKSLTASDRFSFAGRQYITTWSDDGQSSTVVTFVCHKAPYEYLQRFTTPKSRAGRAILENHSYQWTFVPQRQIVVQTPRPHVRSDEPNIPLLLKNYDITMESKTDRIAGRDASIITITSKSRKDKALKYWIDPYTGIALRSERYHADGNLASVSYFSDITFHPKYTAATFTPNQWPDTQVKQLSYKTTTPHKLSQSEVAQTLGKRATVPENIREFEFSGMSKLAMARQETLHIHYSDGLTSLSVFESTKLGKKATRMPGSKPVKVNATVSGRVTERYNYSLLNFDTPQLTVTFLGDLSPETLADLASAFPIPVEAIPQRSHR